MKIRIISTSYDNKKCYTGKQLTITGGFNFHEKDLSCPVRSSLERSEWFYATDGLNDYEILDIGKQFSLAIASRKLGIMEMYLGIATVTRVAIAYTQFIYVLEYESRM